MTDQKLLSDFEGHEVLASTIAVTNAGDGLSEALAVEPQELHHGQTVYVVMECTVTKVSHVPVKGTDALTRVHTLRAGTATMMDSASVRKALDAQRRKVEESQGVRRLPLDPDPGLNDEDKAAGG